MFGILQGLLVAQLNNSMLWHGALNGGVVGLTAGLLAPWLNLRLCRLSLLQQLGRLGLRLAEYLGPTALKGLVLGHYLSPREEQRLFLFIDIQGSTALTQQLGAGHAQLLFAEFIYQVSTLIRQHGGEVQRYVGDQVMATWPHPQGIKTALRCLEDLAQQLPDWNRSYQQQFGTSLNYHAGLSGGPVIAKEVGAQYRSVEFFGDAVNTAARLEKLAGECGTTLVLPTWLLAKSPEYLARAKPLGPQQLKGIALPLEVMQLELAS